MDVKIAIASSDGKTITEHFGRARQFRIYRLHDNGHEYLETRENEPVCVGQAHDDGQLFRLAEMLSDCRGAIAAQIGSGAIDALLYYRVMAFALPGTIDGAVEALLKTKRFNFLK